MQIALATFLILYAIAMFHWLDIPGLIIGIAAFAAGIAVLVDGIRTRN
jgi:hypothetical protein